MIHACNYARLNQVPYLGICLGMQIAIIEFARNVLKIKKLLMMCFVNVRNEKKILLAL